MDPESEAEDYRLMEETLAEAKLGRDEGGVPIGSVLAIDGADRRPRSQPAGAAE